MRDNATRATSTCDRRRPIPWTFQGRIVTGRTRSNRAAGIWAGLSGALGFGAGASGPMGCWLLDWADGGRTGLLLNRAGPLDDWATGPACGLLLDWVFPVRPGKHGAP
ncbi:hypothetical protein CRG98_045391, partial [Punica granatum]